MIVNNDFMIFFRGARYMLKVVIVFHKRIVLLEFARRAGGQVVSQICVVVFAMRRSVSFYGSINWYSIDN